MGGHRPALPSFLQESLSGCRVGQLWDPTKAMLWGCPSRVRSQQALHKSITPCGGREQSCVENGGSFIFVCIPKSALP